MGEGNRRLPPNRQIIVGQEYADVSIKGTIVLIMDTSANRTAGEVLLGKTRGAVLGLLLGRPDEEFHVRQIARLSGATLGPVQRELKLLEHIGVLKQRAVGRQLLYRADEASPIHDELRSLVIKTVGMADVLRAALLPLGKEIQIAFLFGSFARGNQHAASDVDLMIIGTVNLATVARALAEPQRRLGREINPSIYSPSEFRLKLQGGHHFLNSVMAAPRIFIIGDEHELLRMAEERLHDARTHGVTCREKVKRNR